MYFNVLLLFKVKCVDMKSCDGTKVLSFIYQTILNALREVRAGMKEPIKGFCSHIHTVAISTAPTARVL